MPDCSTKNEIKIQYKFRYSLKFIFLAQPAMIMTMSIVRERGCVC